VFVEIAVGAAAFIATMPFWKYEKAESQSRVLQFFERMNRPVDFSREVGKGNDTRQMKTMGTFAIIAGVFMCSLVFVPGNDWSLSGRGGILFVGGIALVIGAALLAGGILKRGER